MHTEKTRIYFFLLCPKNITSFCHYFLVIDVVNGELLTSPGSSGTGSFLSFFLSQTIIGLSNDYIASVASVQ